MKTKNVVLWCILANQVDYRCFTGHCQVPCGIFDDPRIVLEVREHCATIRKAMVKINELAGDMNAQNFNQMTRWVNTKEECVLAPL